MQSILENKFQNHHLLICPTGQTSWLNSHAGASCVKKIDNHKFEMIISGRDLKNRSTLGRALLDLSHEVPKIILEEEPLFTHGNIGAFDENGVSYPSLVHHDGRDYLYYTGWMLTALTPFQNQLGLALRQPSERNFKRHSKAPILERTNEDYTSIGSSTILKIGPDWHMWYTGFGDWMEKKGKFDHTYCIKYAHSLDGISWNRENIICIPNSNNSPNVARPTVFFDQKSLTYHMWFCFRGDEYKIGFAYSKDGKNWTRNDEMSGFSPSQGIWDNQSQCYPFAFQDGEYLYLIYCGNRYGQGGLGICRSRLK